MSDQPLVGAIALIRTMPCLADPGKIMVIGETDAAVEAGLILLAAMSDLLNQTWARRDEIEPRPEGCRVPRPLDVYELLPRTNCRACGEPTCMAFAFGLLEGG